MTMGWCWNSRRARDLREEGPGRDLTRSGEERVMKWERTKSSRMKITHTKKKRGKEKKNTLAV